MADIKIKAPEIGTKTLNLTGTLIQDNNTEARIAQNEMKQAQARADATQNILNSVTSFADSANKSINNVAKAQANALILDYQNEVQNLQSTKEFQVANLTHQGINHNWKHLNKVAEYYKGEITKMGGASGDGQFSLLDFGKLDPSQLDESINKLNLAHNALVNDFKTKATLGVIQNSIQTYSAERQMQGDLYANSEIDPKALREMLAENRKNLTALGITDSSLTLKNSNLSNRRIKDFMDKHVIQFKQLIENKQSTRKQAVEFMERTEKEFQELLDGENEFISGLKTTNPNGEVNLTKDGEVIGNHIFSPSYAVHDNNFNKWVYDSEQAINDRYKSREYNTDIFKGEVSNDKIDAEIQGAESSPKDKEFTNVKLGVALGDSFTLEDSVVYDKEIKGLYNGSKGYYTKNGTINQNIVITGDRQTLQNTLDSKMGRYKEYAFDVKLKKAKSLGLGQEYLYVNNIGVPRNDAEEDQMIINQTYKESGKPMANEQQIARSFDLNADVIKPSTGEKAVLLDGIYFTKKM